MVQQKMLILDLSDPAMCLSDKLYSQLPLNSALVSNSPSLPLSSSPLKPSLFHHIWIFRQQVSYMLNLMVQQILHWIDKIACTTLYLRQRGDGLLLIPRARSLASFDGLPSIFWASFEFSSCLKLSALLHHIWILMPVSYMLTWMVQQILHWMDKIASTSYTLGSRETDSWSLFFPSLSHTSLSGLMILKLNWNHNFKCILCNAMLTQSILWRWYNHNIYSFATANLYKSYKNILSVPASKRMEQFAMLHKRSFCLPAY